MLERNADYLRFRIQQEIDLKDDEIDRVHARLVDFKSEIEEARHYLKQLDQDIERARYGKKCSENSKTVQFSYLSTQLRRDFHEQVRELRHAQAAEIDALQRHFQASLKKCERKKADLKLETVAAEMDEVRKAIEVMREEIDHMQKLEAQGIRDATDKFSLNVKSNVVRDLRRTLFDKNEERRKELEEIRNQMSDCVHAIEEMDREHATRTESTKHKIELLDTQYEMTVRRIRDEHEHRMRILNAQLQKAKMKSRGAKRAMDRAEKTNADAIGQSYRNMDLMRERFVDFEGIAIEEAGEIEKAANEYKTRKAQCDRKLEVLQGLRSDNDSMKRELGRLKFEIRFPRMPSQFQKNRL